MESIGAILKTIVQSPITSKNPKSTSPKSTPGEWQPNPALVKELAELKAKQGYGPNPYCSACHGAGRVHPMENGRVNYRAVIDCTAQDCLADSWQEYQCSDVAILSRGVTSISQTFEDFKLLPGTEKAYRAFKDLADGKANYNMLFCYGVTGNGKSRLCDALAIALNRRGLITYYLTAPRLFAALKNGIEDFTVDALVEGYAKMPGLIIDDLSQSRGGDFELSKLEDIIDRRYRERFTGKQVTVLTMNKGLDWLEQMSPRILSRFRDADYSRLVLNSGVDVRDKISSYRRAK